MRAFIYFITTIITKVFQQLDVYIFPDMRITYLQLILGCMVIGVILKLIYGGIKENSHISNSIIGGVKTASSVSRDISNAKRRKQIVDDTSKGE